MSRYDKMRIPLVIIPGVATATLGGYGFIVAAICIALIVYVGELEILNDGLPPTS